MLDEAVKNLFIADGKNDKFIHSRKWNKVIVYHLVVRAMYAHAFFARYLNKEPIFDSND